MHDDLMWGIKNFLNSGQNTGTIDQQIAQLKQNINNVENIITGLANSSQMAHPSNNNKTRIFSGSIKKFNKDANITTMDKTNVLYWTAPVTGHIRLFFKETTPNFSSGNRVLLYIAENPNPEFDKKVGTVCYTEGPLEFCQSPYFYNNYEGSRYHLTHTRFCTIYDLDRYYGPALNNSPIIHSSLFLNSPNSSYGTTPFIVEIPVVKGYMYGFYLSSKWDSSINRTLTIDYGYEMGAPIPIKKHTKIYGFDINNSSKNIIYFPAIKVKNFILLRAGIGGYDFALEPLVLENHPDYSTSFRIDLLYRYNYDDRFKELQPFFEGYELW